MEEIMKDFYYESITDLTDDGIKLENIETYNEWLIRNNITEEKLKLWRYHSDAIRWNELQVKTKA